MLLRRLGYLALLLGLLLVTGTASSQTLPTGQIFYSTSDNVDYVAQAQELLSQMSVEERVGQVFLVTLEGSTISEQSAIAQLIREYKIGGVVLRRDNDNFIGPEGTAQQVAHLTNQLQQMALLGYLPRPPEDDPAVNAPTPTPNPAPPANPVPLLIAISQEGDGYPNSSILAGLTDIPSQMAIGATWQPSFARATGAILGRELAALGFNLLLGPSLDVLENPSPFSGSDLGVRTFGGDPYWVGLMGQAYTAGVHEGSNGRLAVAGTHFPGYGSSDRPLNEEVATVRKSLEQLKQIELAPFVTVTGDAVDPASTVDALLTSHIRYQGFQGNIRATTAPVSFDPQALTTLMQLPEFGRWRQQGGVLVSEALGVRAVQRFYDDREREFPHRLIAKDAILAGNDLLNLGNFALRGADAATRVANVEDTITWFHEKYRTDQTFQQRVDDAAARILQLKLRLYGNDFSPASVLTDPVQASDIVDTGNAAMFDLAQEAVTLIYPSSGELIDRLPRPPGFDDRIVIFTDVRSGQQCRSCPQQALIAPDALARRMLALYGPDASGQVRASQIESFTFDDLKAFLAAGPGPIPPPTESAGPAGDEGGDATPGPTPTPAPTPTIPPAYRVQTGLSRATWIIFAMLDITPEHPNSDALRLFLAQRPDIIRNARVVVFAYNAPYFLDTTEISKLSAYYGIYSKTEPFIDASVRALFQESPLAGNPPVDVDGISYDLFTITQPDPNQIIDLLIAGEMGSETPPDDEPLELSAGDILRLQTGVIVDRNGNPVPDGTLVQFVRQNLVNGFVDVIVERPTVSGVAQTDIVLERRTGQFRISVVAGPARVSQVVDINTGENVTVIEITVTPAPTAVPTDTPTPTPTPSPTATATPPPLPTAEPAVAAGEPALQISLSELQMLLGLMAGLGTLAGGGWLAARRQPVSIARQLRWLFWGLVGGLIAYNYFALDLPGTTVLDGLGYWAGFLTVLAGGLAGLFAFWLRDRATA